MTARHRTIRAALCAIALASTSVAAFAQATSPAAPPPKPAPPAPPPPRHETPNVDYVQLTTSKGDIVLELNREKAPITVENFLKYVDKKHYDGTVFHRIMKDFMIQGGGYTADGRQKPTDAPIKLEAGNGLSNKRGTIAMARTGDPNSATSQFFINTVDNAKLDRSAQNPGYAVFGKVVAGMATVELIRNVPVEPNPMGELSKPRETVTITMSKRLAREEAQKLIDAEPKPEPAPKPPTQ